MSNSKPNLTKEDVVSWVITAIMLLVFLGMLRCVTSYDEPKSYDNNDLKNAFFGEGLPSERGRVHQSLSTCADSNLGGLIICTREDLNSVLLSAVCACGRKVRYTHYSSPYYYFSCPACFIYDYNISEADYSSVDSNFVFIRETE